MEYFVDAILATKCEIRAIEDIANCNFFHSQLIEYLIRKHYALVADCL